MVTRFSHFVRAWQGDRSDAKCGALIGRSQECVRSWAEGLSTPTKPSFPILAPLLGITAEALAEMVEAERAVRAAASTADLAADATTAAEIAANAVPATEPAGALGALHD